MADRWARRYGRRPCEMLRPEERDHELDLALDLAALDAALLEEHRTATRAGAMGVVVLGGG